MKNKIFVEILIGIVILMLLIKFSTTIFIEPWLGEKINAALNEKNRDFTIELNRVHILIIRSGIVLEGITICSKQDKENVRDLCTETEFIKFTGINLAKVIFKHDIYIKEINISNSSIKGKIPFSGKAIPPLVSLRKIRAGRILFDNLNLAVENVSNAHSYSVKEGVLKIYDLKVEKQDTLSLRNAKQFDFEAGELVSVSSDSIYSYLVKGIVYSETLRTLTIDSLYIHPNYTDYDFTSRYKFQTNRIEAFFTNIYVHDFYHNGYSRSMSLESSCIEIGEMDMRVFRDKRKELRHLDKPAFQDLLYDLPNTIQIDSIVLMNGNITYTVHAEEANEPGIIRFNNISSRLYNITNNTIYRTESAFLEVKADALLMGKGKVAISLKGRLFDRNNTFSMNGTLSDMEANELNPILEKNAFVYLTSGKIDAMNFSFTANNTKATGEMTMLYHGLNITVKNKRTDDTTAFRERFISFIANRRVLDSNPIPGKEVRQGVIDFERDHERFLLHYCFRSVLSGITSSLTVNPNKRDN